MTKKRKEKETDEKAREYDSAWKDVIEEHFEPFLEFFFPDIHKDIDFSKRIEFLSKELRKIAPHGKVGKRYADALVKVHLKDGSVGVVCIFIHVEIQGSRIVDFEEGIYIYNYRIFNQYRDQGIEVVSLAILTDEDENYRPDEYHVSRWGFDHRMKFPLVKIIDYRNKPEYIEKLEKSTSPMAMVVRAQLKSHEAKKSEKHKKFDIKRDLIKRCYREGYGKKQIRTLLKFIDWIIRLPKDLEKQVSEEIVKLEEERKMPYVTSWERMAKEEGEISGVRKGKRETAMNLLKIGISKDIIARATGFPMQQIEELAAEVH